MYSARSMMTGEYLHPREFSRVLSFGITFLLCTACSVDSGTPDPNNNATALLANNTCEVGDETGSPWYAEGGVYMPGSTFGLATGEELNDVWGVVSAPDASVLVYDAGNTRVLKLDHELRVLETIGRNGRGPGEFVYQMVSPAERLAADSSGFVVLDLRAVSRFDLAGNFTGYATSTHSPVQTLKKLSSDNGRIIYTSDLFDGDGGRFLQTWLLNPEGPPTLLRSDPMPPLPISQGRAVRGVIAKQAEPLWAHHGRCVFVSDGSGDWILRVDLDTNKADTIRLPPRDLPEWTDEDEATLMRLRTGVARVGANTGDNRITPTAPLKWDEMVVDPAGYVWLKPWRPWSTRRDPVTVWIVHPGSGTVDSLVVGAFPTAFLDEGKYVAREIDEVYVNFLRTYQILQSSP